MWRTQNIHSQIQSESFQFKSSGMRLRHLYFAKAALIILSQPAEVESHRPKVPLEKFWLITHAEPAESSNLGSLHCCCPHFDVCSKLWILYSSSQMLGGD